MHENKFNFQCFRKLSADTREKRNARRLQKLIIDFSLELNMKADHKTNVVRAEKVKNSKYGTED